MKIDLHCHTKATKSGDSIKRNILPVEFHKKVNSVDVKIIGVTNHNYFDLEQYNEFLKVVKNDFMVWPGIEMDVIGVNDEHGHVIVVSNPKKVENFDTRVKKILNGKTPDEFNCGIDELLEFIDGLDCIVMPHYFKPKSLDEESIIKIKNNMRDTYRLLYEPANYRSLGILINHNRNSIIGSDVKDWDKYHEYEFANLKIDVDSYEQFITLIKKDVSLIETLLQKQYRTTIDISYSRTYKENVDFYDDINIFFGSKGTGKSEALKKVNEFFISKGKNIGYYEPKNTQDKIDEKLDIDDSERQLSLYEKDNLKTEFNSISEWTDENITQFKDYLGYISSKNKNTNKEKMKILEVTTITNEYLKLYQSEKANLQIVNNIEDNLKKLKLDNYLELDEVTELKLIIGKLVTSINNSKNTLWRNSESVKLSNFTVEKLKNIVEKNTELKTKPSDTGFLKFAQNRLKIKQVLNRIVSAFSYKFNDSVINVGKLEEGKDLNLRTIIKMLNEKSRTEEFSLGIQALRNVKKSIIESYNNVLDINFSLKISELVNLINENGIISMDDFLGIIKRFEINDEKYSPSTGEATMILLDEILKGDYDVYILDEPEKSLGNAYVNDVLVPRINELAKLKKTVVIVTHNANVAVRTFPFRSVLKEYKNGVYKTYVGNPYTNKLININDQNDTKDWKAESIKILEGGKEAFEERGEIYGE